MQAITHIMNYLYSNPILSFFIIILVLGALPRDGDNPFKEIRVKLAQPALDALKSLFSEIGSQLKIDHDTPDNRQPAIIVQQVGVSLTNVSDYFETQFTGLQSKLSGYRLSLLTLVTGEDTKYGYWRIVGSVFTFMLLLLFLWADAIQIFGTSKLIFAGTDYAESLGEFGRRWNLDRLEITYIVSSIGTTFTLAFIYIDSIRITHFIPMEYYSNHPDSQNPEKQKVSFRKNIRRYSKWLLFLNILLIVVASFGRFSSLPYPIHPNKRVMFESFAYGAQALSILPMVLTSAMLYWGIMAPVVFVALFLGLFSIFISVLNGLFQIAKRVGGAVGPAGVFSVGFLMIILSTLFTVLGLGIGIVLHFIESITFVLEKSVDTIQLIVFRLFSTVRYLLFLDKDNLQERISSRQLILRVILIGFALFLLYEADIVPTLIDTVSLFG